MGNARSIALKNSTVSFLAQLISMIFQFMNRTVFIYYLGFELLGINGTFISVFNTLSLAELGFQSAIVYHLYKPLNSKNEIEINQLMNIYKTVYFNVGMLILMLTLLLMPFIRYILKGIEITNAVYIYFGLMGVNSALTYFLAYKRALVYADQKDYINKVIDSLCIVTFSVLKIILVIKTKNYYLFLLITICQTIVSNCMVHVFCKKQYPFLKKENIDTNIAKKVFNSVKELFAARLAGYVYSSTDNLVISALVSTISVGLYGNYTLVTANLKTLISSMVNPITPIIGRQLAEGKNDTGKDNILSIYTYIRMVIGVMTIVPICILLQKFVSFWAGKDGLLNETVVYLLAIDIYIHIVHSALCDFINGQGLFKYDKYAEFIGATSNIVFSLAFVFKFGVAGVLLGTIISQSVFWIGRAFIVFKYCFEDGKRYAIMYVTKNIYYICCICVITVVLSILLKKIELQFFIVEFLIKGIICELVVASGIIAMTGWQKEFKSIVKKIVRST